MIGAGRVVGCNCMTIAGEYSEGAGPTRQLGQFDTLPLGADGDRPVQMVGGLLEGGGGHPSVSGMRTRAPASSVKGKYTSSRRGDVTITAVIPGLY